MKRNVLVFGLISGALIATFVVVTMNIWGCESYSGSMYVGYAAQILALSLVYVGIKNYRDKENGGVITFGKAFKIGLLMSFIASTIYVVAWVIDYHFFIPDFMDKYAAHMVQQAKSSGATAAEISKQVAEAAQMKEMYKNPVIVVAFTYLEIFPTGLLVSLVAALVLKRKAGGDGAVAV
jgi:uncharacterized membrane protein